ncbi:DUF5110 domain-containing protein [bacterium]|nr:DUF5110 domain-containing protein [bacterium]MBU1984222.1 DUF5110 domain-containing protein [bacterium]
MKNLSIFLNKTILRCVLTVVVTVVSVLPALAGYEFLGNAKSAETIPGGIAVRCDGGHTLRMVFVTDHVLRITLERTGDDETLLDYALTDIPARAIVPVVEDRDSLWILQTDEAEVHVNKFPCAVVVLDKSGKTVCADEPGLGIGWDGNEIRCWKTIEANERFFGLGLKVGDVNKRGREWVMWNSDVPAYGWQSDPLYESIPFFVGIRDSNAYGIYFNNSYRTRFNMGAGNLRYYSFAAEGGALDYFVILGPEVGKVVERYSELTGRMPMPPLWALGYQQCRWSYYPDSEVLSLALTFRERRIPCDAIYLDIHYMNDYRVFTWHPNRFSDPRGLCQSLRRDGFRIVTIIDPGVKADTNYQIAREGLEGNHFVRYPDDQTYVGEVWPGKSYFPDFSRRETRKWWGEYVGEWLGYGVSGIWNDMNEPAVWGQAFPTETIFNDDGRIASHKKHHNLYGLLMARATYEGARQSQPNQRPFILTRAGFAGVQRYSAAWTGDNIADWDHLALGIRMMQGMSLSGVPFVGTDVGGFIGSPSGELFTRWIQVGSLSPLLRTHSEYHTDLQEPWSYGRDLEDINRRYIEFRYRLLPYLYSLFRETNRDGTPIWRPLFWNDQGDVRTFDGWFQHQFFVGERLLAVPVIREGEVYQKVYLPEGKWLDWSTHEAYEGPREIIVDAPLDRLPLFLREGAIIPMRDVVQYTGERPISTLSLTVFPSNVLTEFELYEDDGETFAYLKGGYRITNYACQNATDSVVISKNISHDGYAPAKRGTEILLQVQYLPPAEVLLDGRPLPATCRKEYDAESHVLTLRLQEGVVWERIVVR